MGPTWLSVSDTENCGLIKRTFEGIVIVVILALRPQYHTSIEFCINIRPHGFYKIETVIKLTAVPCLPVFRNAK